MFALCSYQLPSYIHVYRASHTHTHTHTHTRTHTHAHTHTHTTHTQTYMAGLKKGNLFKKKKVDNVWQSRFFVLDKDTLKYYRKMSVSHTPLPWSCVSACLVCIHKSMGTW